MRNPCPRSLDEPIERFGFTYFEYMVGLVSFALVVYYLRAWGIFIPPVIVIAMAWVRRGQNRAFFVHAVQRMDLMPLPGIDSYSRRSFTP